MKLLLLEYRIHTETSREDLWDMGSTQILISRALSYVRIADSECEAYDY